MRKNILSLITTVLMFYIYPEECDKAFIDTKQI